MVGVDFEQVNVDFEQVNICWEQSSCFTVNFEHVNVSSVKSIKILCSAISTKVNLYA